MCYVLYAASSVPLPEIAWNKDQPALHAHAVPEAAAVRHQFTLPHVAYVGCSTHCGCEFGYTGDLRAGAMPEEIADPEELAERAALVDYLGPLVSQGAGVELYACWDGEEAEAAEYSIDFSEADLRTRCFVERGKFSVRGHVES